MRREREIYIKTDSVRPKEACSLQCADSFSALIYVDSVEIIPVYKCSTHDTSQKLRNNVDGYFSPREATVYGKSQSHLDTHMNNSRS